MKKNLIKITGGGLRRLKAFTLAEVLITLAIIGVVAALTIPSVIASYQKKQYVTQLKRSYNNIQNAFHTLMAQDGVTKLTDTKMLTIIAYGCDASTCFANRVFEKEFLKVFKSAKVAPRVNRNNQVEYWVMLADGSHIKFNFISISQLYSTNYTARCGGNQHCTSLREFQNCNKTPTKLWQMVSSVFDIDVNGSKGPNQNGRDIFRFDLGNDGNLYPRYGADYAVFKNKKYSKVINGTAIGYWRYNNNSSCPDDGRGGYGCAARIMEEGWKMNY